MYNFEIRNISLSAKCLCVCLFINILCILNILYVFVVQIVELVDFFYGRLVSVSVK